jgi:hypothetical protein
MAWTAEWKRALSDAQLEPVILADVGTFSWTDSFDVAVLGTTFASQPSVPGIDVEGSVLGGISQEHLISDLRTAGQSVRIRDWTLNTGGFSFALTSSKPGTHALPFVPSRGLHIQLRMGFAGSAARPQVIARGALDAMTHDGDTWWIQCRSFLDVARTRQQSATLYDPDQFFSDVADTTTLSGAWTSNTGDDLPVAELSGFQKDARTGAVGVARVDPDPTTSADAWWFVYSVKSADSGAGTLTASGSADWFGNDDNKEYSSGTTVTHYGVITGQPWNVYGRIIRSTGVESTTGFDTLPREWGLALPLWMIANEDITAMADHPAVDDLDPKWTPFVLGPVDDMLSFLQAGLGQHNMWPVVLEDQLSIRIAYDYRNPDIESVVVDTVDDDWIVSIDTHELYHPDADVEYHKVGGARDAVGALYSLRGLDPDSRPWLERFEKTIAANGLTVGGSENTPDGMTCWEAGTAETQADSRTLTTRAHTWYNRLPEQLKLTTRTLRYAPLVPGDLVSVTSRHIVGRDGLYTDEVCMVTGVIPDWIRGSVVLDLARLPLATTA